ncbi:MAG: YkvA family protein [Tetrasphaera sp.]
MAIRSRLPLIRTLASAVRSATRPGAPALGARLGALPRLVRATTAGTYNGTTIGRLALLGAALAYVVSPVDLMPEGLLLAFGLADDAMVLSWLAATFLTETDAYLAWERAAAGQPSPDGAAPTYPGTPFAQPAGYPAAQWPMDARHIIVKGSARRT